MTFLEGVSLIFSAYCIIKMVNTIGIKINLQESIVAITSIIYLVTPVIAYNIFNKKNSLAVLWQTIMPISSNSYFSFALPSVLCLAVGLYWPLTQNEKISDYTLLERAGEYLDNKKFIGYILVILGLLFGLIKDMIPEMFKAMAYFANQLLFIGVIYLVVCKIKYKAIILLVAFSALLIQAINSGMYGEIVFWGFFILLYLMTKARYFSLLKKVGIVCLGFYGILFIQSIKNEYREKTWQYGVRNGDSRFFFSLVADRFVNPSLLFEEKQLFNMATRGNQGFLLARTMDYVPKHEPFANGETVWLSVQASIIPRLMWKDKPKLGGTENTCRFLGDCAKRDYSYNIGQIGEAYVNFGRIGGVFFLFVYGFLINWGLVRVKYLSIKYPTLILWIPLLFFAALSLETDLLTFLNTFIKGVFFCFMVYTFFKLVFNWKI